MDMQQERPPAYAQHEPESLHLPSVPRHEPPSNSNDRHLPGIRSLDLPNATPSRSAFSATNFTSGPLELNPKTHGEPFQWHHMPPLSHASFPQVPSTVPHASSEMEIGSPMDTASVVSVEDHYHNAPSVVSVDDPDVRLAAEALSGLGNPDFIRSPTSRSLTIPPSQPLEPEPLLSLLTSNHPWLGGTINGSISAYATTKSYSPRFVKYGAELIERNIGSPVVNTVSSVGRRTGMERNLRRYLGESGRRPSDLEQGDSAERKRRRVMSPGDDSMDIETPSTRTRGGSQASLAETLPAYDDQRSPNYEESSIVIAEQKESDPQQNQRVNWSTQLIMTTSGLGVALSDASLKSLKTCLGLLRSATTHIDNAMHALKMLLEEYEQALQRRRQSDGEGDGPAPAQSEKSGAMESAKDDQVRHIADQMKRLYSDIWNTLQQVVTAVARYTGGALPQNASQVVRTQLLSVPQRWRSADRSASEARSGEEVRAANRMLAFAKEGLDMMTQISAVVDGTVQSAEGWLGRMGKRTPDEGCGQRGIQESDKEKEGYMVGVELAQERREKQ